MCLLVLRSPFLKGVSRTTHCTQPNSCAFHLLTPKAQTHATKQVGAIWALVQCRQPINMQMLVFCLHMLNQAQLGQVCKVAKNDASNQTRHELFLEKIPYIPLKIWSVPHMSLKRSQFKLEHPNFAAVPNMELLSIDWVLAIRFLPHRRRYLY